MTLNRVFNLNTTEAVVQLTFDISSLLIANIWCCHASFRKSFFATCPILKMQFKIDEY